MILHDENPPQIISTHIIIRDAAAQSIKKYVQLLFGRYDIENMKGCTMPDEKLTTQSAKMPGHLIRRLHQVSTQVFAQRMRDTGHDLTPIQFSALDALKHNPGIDQAALARAIAKDRATIGAVVDRLEQKGLIARVVNPRDKRARVLTLTDTGTTVITQLLPIVEALQADILPGLSPTEYDLFMTLATKAARAAGIGPDDPV
jgi:DNA-binding MarR family transcriptional regulator